MGDDTLLYAAGRIADGEQVDWAAITSSQPSHDQRGVADQLAVVAQIAAGHRQLHQLVPVASDTPPSLSPITRGGATFLQARAIDRDPPQRPASAADVQPALASLAAPAAVTAAKPRSIGWWVAVAAGVGLLALALWRL